MRWKRILIISLAAVAIVLSLYAVSLGFAGIHTMQTTETDRAQQYEHGPRQDRSATDHGSSFTIWNGQELWRMRLPPAPH